jgi:hypothetical protein
MIFYLARKHQTLSTQLTHFPGKLAAQLRFLTYDDLFGRAVLPAGTYIFTDFDRLRTDRFARLCALWDWFEATGCALSRLNDPRRFLSRFDLLRRLHDAGINDFNVHALEDWREVRSFPVFIRKDKHQDQPDTPLLRTKTDLAEAVARLRGAGPRKRMIVEFANDAFGDGRYRKYGAFRVGQTQFVQHCYMSTSWYIKSHEADRTDADLAEAERYRMANPHARQIAEAFDLAGVDYGRMDYGIAGDRIQIYEINTNPTVIAPNPKIDSLPFARRVEEAILKLPEGNAAEVRLPPELVDSTAIALPIEKAHERALAESIKTRTKRRGATGLLASIAARLLTLR